MNSREASEQNDTYGWMSRFISPHARSSALSKPFVGSLGPPLLYLFQRNDRIETRLLLLETAIAIAEYRTRNSVLPERLESLVPEFLPKIPVDVFDSKPLAYRRLKQGYLLYSFGLDGVDNLGDHNHWTSRARTFRGLGIDHQDGNSVKSIEQWLREFGEDGEWADFEEMIEATTLDSNTTDVRDKVVGEKTDDIAIRFPLNPRSLSAWPESASAQQP